jgi:hypothetical protein
MGTVLHEAAQAVRDPDYPVCAESGNTQNGFSSPTDKRIEGYTTADDREPLLGFVGRASATSATLWLSALSVRRQLVELLALRRVGVDARLAH